MSKTVFISSTYRDLKEHRKQIWNVLQTFNINITGMEEFGARKSTPLQTCLEELERSDIYIGVISMCYGSVDSMTGKSYTQLEYDRAKELGLDILIYLIDENNGEIKTGSIDYGDKKLALDSFKRLLKANHTVDFFINEKDLGDKLSKRLKDLLPEDDSDLKRPKELEAKVYRVKLGDTDWIIFVGFLYGKPFEIFSALKDDEFGVIIPNSVENGILVQRMEDGVLNYDFSFPNKRGYKITIESINEYWDANISTYNINTYDRIISKLLQSNMKRKSLFATINEFDTIEPKYKDWNKKIIEILEPLL